MSVSTEPDAMRYAVNGYRVVAVQPRGKRPLRPGWPNTATADPIEVQKQWRHQPDANIGVASGEGLLVLDADTPAAIATARDHLGIGETVTVATARGAHLYLHGDGPSVAGIAPGIDVRGRRGYVVGAGSTHASGEKYKWTIPPWEIDPAPAPQALLDLLAQRRQRRSEAPQGPIPEGQRNGTLTRRGGALRRAQLSTDAIRAALLAENASRCQPPLPAEEVERIVRSVTAMSGPPPWVADPIGFVDDPQLDHRARLVLTILARHADDDGTVRGGEYIAKLANLHRNRVSEAIRQLKSAGRIEVQRQRRKANEYLLISDDLLLGRYCTDSVHQEPKTAFVEATSSVTFAEAAA